MWSAAGILKQQVLRADVLAFLRKLKETLDGQLILAVHPPLVLAAEGHRPLKASGLFSKADLEALSPFVDAFSLMLYDASNAEVPGPNAPLDWVASNLRHLLPTEELARRAGPLPAVLRSILTDDEFDLDLDLVRLASPDASILATEDAIADFECRRRPEDGLGCEDAVGDAGNDAFGKILMGLNFYGNDYSLPPQGGGPILGREFIDRLQRHRPGPERWMFNEETKGREAAFVYDEGGVRRVVFYPTPRTIWERLVIAHRLELGISIWELGQGLPCLFDLL